MHTRNTNKKVVHIFKKMQEYHNLPRKITFHKEPDGSLPPVVDNSVSG